MYTRISKEEEYSIEYKPGHEPLIKAERGAVIIPNPPPPPLFNMSDNVVSVDEYEEDQRKP